MRKAGVNHFGTVRLETKRLVLRRFREEDALPAFQNWESDEKVTEFLRWRPCKTIEETKDILDHWIDSYRRPDFISGPSYVRAVRTSRLAASARWRSVREPLRWRLATVSEETGGTGEL